ncbi:MAG: ATP-binding cassette domain-containing protein [Candidatus Eremiobacteraeota bacterium]|nr:ATP-binding cassette domain-containing protein [Candidatus Eremiobacteraeota bacterium]
MLCVQDIQKSFGNVQAVRDVCFQFERGSTFGLLGPNGAGKTTTMRMILGILTPDRGTMTWDGERIDGRMRRRFGYLPEERGLYGKMKVREQIAYFGRLHGMLEPQISRRTDFWIEHLALQPYANRPAGELSKGNQQKVQVACSAVHEPELLVLDEPFSGLDPVNAEMLLAALKELRARGTTLVLSSHQMWQLEDLCSKFCIISGGLTIASGTLAELRSELPTRVLHVAPATQNANAVLARIPGARALPPSNGSLSYKVQATTSLPEVLRELVSVEAITRFEAVAPSLQDIYLRAIGTAQ